MLSGDGHTPPETCPQPWESPHPETAASRRDTLGPPSPPPAPRRPPGRSPSAGRRGPQAALVQPTVPETFAPHTWLCLPAAHRRAGDQPSCCLHVRKHDLRPSDARERRWWGPQIQPEARGAERGPRRLLPAHVLGSGASRACPVHPAGRAASVPGLGPFLRPRARSSQRFRPPCHRPAAPGPDRVHVCPLGDQEPAQRPQDAGGQTPFRKCLWRWHAGGFPAGRSPEGVAEQWPREAECLCAGAPGTAAPGEGGGPLRAQNGPAGLGRGDDRARRGAEAEFPAARTPPSRAPGRLAESQRVGIEQRHDVANQPVEQVSGSSGAGGSDPGEEARAEELAPGFTSALRTVELKITLKMKLVMNLQLPPPGAGAARGWSSPQFPALFKYFMRLVCSVRRSHSSPLSDGSRGAAGAVGLRARGGAARACQAGQPSGEGCVVGGRGPGPRRRPALTLICDSAGSATCWRGRGARISHLAGTPMGARVKERGRQPHAARGWRSRTARPQYFMLFCTLDFASVNFRENKTFPR